MDYTGGKQRIVRNVDCVWVQGHNGTSKVLISLKCNIVISDKCVCNSFWDVTFLAAYKNIIFFSTVEIDELFRLSLFKIS